MYRITPLERRKGISREYIKRISEELDSFIREPRRMLIDNLIRRFDGYFTIIETLDVFIERLSSLTYHGYVSKELSKTYAKIKTLHDLSMH